MRRGVPGIRACGGVAVPSAAHRPALTGRSQLMQTVTSHLPSPAPPGGQLGAGYGGHGAHRLQART